MIDADSMFLDDCLERSKHERPLFHHAEVMRIYALAGHQLSGNIPEWLTLREPIVRSLVAMARGHCG